MKKLIPKGQYGYRVPTQTWRDIGSVLNKGAEFFLKGLEPIGRVITSFAASPQHGATSYATTGQYRIQEKAKEQKLKEKAFEETVGPALSPSNHVVAWTQGSWNPKVGQQKIAEWGPLAQLGSIAVDTAIGKNTVRIGNNVANRNLFSYKYIRPASYEHPIKRGMKVVRHILTDKTPNPLTVEPAYGNSKLGEYIYRPKLGDSPELTEKANELASRFRDASQRKYLGLPEKEPIYIKNSDGTFKYNLPYIEKLYKQYGLRMEVPNQPYDFVTGNGGNLESLTTEIISQDNKYGVRRIKDTYDLHPFSRTEDRIINKVSTKVADNAYKLYEKLYPYIYNNSAIGRFGYKYLGGRALNKLRFEGFEPKWLSKLSDKVAKYEVGPLLGGKPFVMETKVPFTRVINLDGFNGTNLFKEVYGHVAEPYKLLPTEVMTFKNTGLTPNDFKSMHEFESINIPRNFSEYNIKNIHKRNKEGGKLCLIPRN